ncbi:glycoside hydrolase family 32 protein [Sinomonas albida]|uniref:glycoside hydrolase family 32 protein n=1 Tax=Sinomonas albida TaxID=369942 RepID=UPI00301A88E1
MSIPSQAIAEDYRPALHFTADRTWINDPNGLIHHRGLYHLFYQNNPHGNVWGNISWGHATSPDLVHWSEHSVAISSDEREDAFSGSVVFDRGNTSGFGTQQALPLVAVYTSAFKRGTPNQGIQAQSLAYSLDGGFTWTKHASNPVLSRDSGEFRDPKVFWYPGPGKPGWIMAAVEAVDRKVVLYRSDDLKSWDPLSEFGPANATGGVWECPDLFPLPLDGDHTNIKWVLTVNLNPGGPNGGSAGQYFVGHFDGREFISETTITEGIGADAEVESFQWIDWGRDYYAAVSFNDAPDGRRIMIGWMNNWDYAERTPTAPWRSAMSLPREITLVSVDGKPRLRQIPVPEVDQQFGHTFSLGPVLLNNETFPVPTPEASARVIEVEFGRGTASQFGVVVRSFSHAETRITVRPAAGLMFLDRTKSGDTSFHPSFASRDTAPIRDDGGRYILRVYLDRCSAEVFAQNGLVAMTELAFPDEPTALALFADGGTAPVSHLTVRALNSE